MPFHFNQGQYNRFVARVTDNARQTTREVAREAAEAFASAVMETMNTVFENAVTPTGQRRAERRGGHPGRIDTGRMVDAISHDIEEHGTVTVSRAGFVNEQLAYFAIQAGGSEYKVGTHALEQGFQAGVRAAREVLNRRWGR